jgi:hypothetical protein
MHQAAPFYISWENFLGKALVWPVEPNVFGIKKGSEFSRPFLITVLFNTLKLTISKAHYFT